MARLVFADDTLVYSLQGNLFVGKPGTKVYIYLDALATTLADIQDMANGAIVGSFITVDSSSQLPLFQGPNDGRDTLYAKPEGGAAAQPIYARVDDRLDALALIPNLGATSLALTGMGAAVETTASTVYVDLATVGPVNAVNIGASGRALVIMTAYMSNNGAFNNIMAFAISGATVRAVDENRALMSQAVTGSILRASSISLVTGLTPGATTFTAKYRVSGGTGSFTDRQLIVIPL